MNREATLSFPGGWNDPFLPKLWLYNLHYFDDLGADAGAEHAQACGALMEQWVRENPPPVGNGWEPYTLSLRSVNWLKHALAGGRLSDVSRDSLALQLRALEQRLEWHLLANHLFANAKALIFGGACFAGEEGDRWLRKGLRILDREITEQILTDGGHVERSPMYHAIILEDVLDLLNLSAAYPGLCQGRDVLWRDTANRMRRWLAAMCHPDGDIAFFNDCALGVSASPSELEAYARRLDLPEAPSLHDVEDLADSGYVRLRAGPFTLFFDAAPIGPDYQPGHAHADTLSFELSLGADRVLVNGGVSTYEEGPRRSEERATSSHNTIEVNDRSCSEMWAAFRVARRAKILKRTVLAIEGGALVAGAHDGYRHLPGQPIPRRNIECARQRIVITDHVDGEFNRAASRFRFAPGLVASLAEGAREGTVSKLGRLIARWSSSQPGQLRAATHAFAFSEAAPIQELLIDFDRAGLETVWRDAT